MRSFKPFTLLPLPTIMMLLASSFRFSMGAAVKTVGKQINDFAATKTAWRQTDIVDHQQAGLLPSGSLIGIG